MCTEVYKHFWTELTFISYFLTFAGGIFRSIPNRDDYEGFRAAIDFINENEKQKTSKIKFEGIAEFTDNDEELDNVLKGKVGCQSYGVLVELHAYNPCSKTGWQ